MPLTVMPHDQHHHHGGAERPWAAVLAVAAVAVVGYLLGRTGAPQRSTPAGSPSRKLTVTASFYPLAYFAARIGGDKADVENVTPAGAEPHDYEPTAQDIARMEDSDVVILNGGGLEAWGDDIRKNVDPGRTVVATVGEGLASAKVEKDGKPAVDPHAWLDPSLAKTMVDRIAQAYDRADPADAARYDAAAIGLKADLDALDAEYRRGLASCAKKDIVTSHAAFSYLAARYGLNQVAIAGLSPDTEPSPSDLAAVAAFAQKNAVRYVFFESLVSPKLSDTIATEVGAKTLVLNPMEGLTAAQLAAGDDYLSVMRSNLANLRIALECTQ